MTIWAKSVTSILLTMLLSGCSTSYFHTQTTWNEDGSVERAIHQPDPGSSVNSQDDWDRSWRTQAKDFDFRGDIKKLPEVDDDTAAFAATGKFESWTEVPQHYLSGDSDTRFHSTFERNASREDYGVAIEFLWRETLTDIVTLGDARNAIRDGGALSGRYLQFLAEESLGPEYNASELNTWLSDEGVTWASELFDILYDAAARGGDPGSDDLKPAIARVCRAHGLNITLTDDSEKSDERELDRFLKELVRRTIRKSNGSSIDETLVSQIVASFTDNEVPGTEKLKKKAERASDKFARHWPGGAEVFKSTYTEIAMRIFGIHGFPLASPEEFRFQMKFPGEVVEANGKILRNDLVQWSFSRVEAWPSGYSMTARSLLPHASTLKLFGEKPIDRERLSRIVDLIGEDEAIRQTLIKCRTEKSRQPLDALYKDSKDVDTRKRIRKLKSLL